ncbi:MAG: lipocalin-like domain-containing protein [Desulfobacterales bacterium]|jgi:predicted secreted hydrolase
MKRIAEKVVSALSCLFLMAALADHSVMAEDQDGYLAVTGPCNLTFPRDHGSHPGYRIEWWYYTGNLLSDSGERYGFQLTFFRNQISPSGHAEKWPQPSSAWRTQQIYVGHAAISDLNEKKHRHAEQMARAALGMAGVDQHGSETTVFLKDWSATIGADSHTLKVRTVDFAFDLRLQPVKPPVLHGQAGYSRKGSTAERASCYYSLTRLKTKGMLKIDGKTVSVEGLSWMDHEYSTASLEEGIIGWDWFSLQLSDQSELMLYLLRNQNGQVNPASSGTFIDPSGASRHLTTEDFRLTAIQQWESSRSGAVYPVAWHLKIDPLEIEISIVANLSDQEMVTTSTTEVIYWEGSVSATGSIAEKSVVAEGYMELTGYAESAGAPL